MHERRSRLSKPQEPAPAAQTRSSGQGWWLVVATETASWACGYFSTWGKSKLVVLPCVPLSHPQTGTIKPSFFKWVPPNLGGEFGGTPLKTYDQKQRRPRQLLLGQSLWLRIGPRGRGWQRRKHTAAHGRLRGAKGSTSRSPSSALLPFLFGGEGSLLK